MPYERKQRKRKRRRRPRNRNGTVSSLATGSPFPVSYLTSHRYVETVEIDAGLLSPSVVYYSANGLYDPTTAVGGHQPLGFDQMTPLYDHYTVLGSKATIRFFSADPDASAGTTMVYCYVNDDATAVTTYDTVLEQQKGRVASLTSSDAKGTATIVQKFSAKKFFGVTDVKDNEQLKGSSGANPSDGAYYVIGCQGLSQSSNPTKIFANVTIDYITLWTERRDLAQSA